MDTRLLKHYEQELSFMRDMGAEFATAYPKIAGRLGIEPFEVLDPYVERMMEGFAFMAARVQLELDMQYPVMTQNLLEIVYPHYLAPVPSMMIAKLTPDMSQGNLNAGFTLPRGTELRGKVREGEQTACVFTTSQDATLWPLAVTEAEYIASRGELVAAGVAPFGPAKAAIRIRLARIDGAPLAALPMDRLTVHLPGNTPDTWRLYEAIVGQGIGLAGRATDRRADWALDLGSAIHPRGFDPQEALLPTPRQSFDGYRLLQEYFALPQRFFFIDLADLGPAIQRSSGTDLDIYILLKDGSSALASVNETHFDLHAVPAINLFERRCDRAHVRATEVEHLLTVDRTAPMDYEIYQIKQMDGIGSEDADDVRFRPFYSADSFTPSGETANAYYAQRRRLRQASDRQKQVGARSSYLGSELYVSLSDRRQAPYPGDIKQLAVTALCTNRDLPMLTPIGAGDTDFTLPEGGPIQEVRALVPPTMPRQSLVEGQQAWKLISHLSLNYLSLTDADRGQAAAAMRELLGLYAPPDQPALHKQLSGLRKVEARPIVRRISEGVLSTAVRGLEIRIHFDESDFEGTGCFLLGAVLETFFAKYVALNSFTETVVETQQRGEIIRWPAKSGRRTLI